MLDILRDLENKEERLRFAEEQYEGDVEATCAMESSLSCAQLTTFLWLKLCPMFSKEVGHDLILAVQKRWAAKCLEQPTVNVTDILLFGSDASMSHDCELRPEPFFDVAPPILRKDY
jgi:hypothetical protein